MGGYEQAIADRRRWKRIAHQARRDAAIDAYGGKCGQCGSQDRSALEVHNRYHRYWAKAMTGRAIRGGEDKYRLLEQLGFPQNRGFDLICEGCRTNGATRPPGGRRQ